jgi:MFS family permease
MITKLGLRSLIVYTLLIAGILLLILFVYVERRVKDPIVNLSLFRNSAFSGALLSLLFYWMAVQGYALTMPFYLMEGRGLASSYVGILYTVVSIVSFLVSPVSGFLSDRFGSALFSSIGAGILIIGLCSYLNFGPQTQISFIVFVFIIMGMGSGTFLTTNSSTIMGSVRPEQRGSASALMASTIGLSLSLGMAWASTVYSMRRVFHQAELTKQGLGADFAANQSIHLSFHDTILISMVLQAMVLVFSLLPRIIAWRRGQAVVVEPMGK